MRLPPPPRPPPSRPVPPPVFTTPFAFVPATPAYVAASPPSPRSGRPVGCLCSCPHLDSPAPAAPVSPASLGSGTSTHTSTPDTSPRSSTASQDLDLCASPSSSSSSSSRSKHASSDAAPPLRPAWLSDERRRSNRSDPGRRVRIIAHDYRPLVRPPPPDRDSAPSPVPHTKPFWTGYGTLWIDVEAAPGSPWANRNTSLWRNDTNGKYLRRRALSVLGAVYLFCILVGFLLRELLWLHAPPAEQVLVPTPYRLPPSYNASVLRLIPFTDPAPSPAGAGITSDDAAPVSRGPWVMQARYDFEPSSPSDGEGPHAETLLLFHSVGRRHRGHVHVHTAHEPVGPHAPPTTNATEGQEDVASISASACRALPRATAQIYAYGPHPDLLAPTLALAEVITSDGRRGLTLASHITPWYDKRNTPTVHVELTLHPGTCHPSSDRKGKGKGKLDQGQQPSEAQATAHARRSKMAIDMASSRLGVTFHGAPSSPNGLPQDGAQPEPANGLALRSLRLSSYSSSIHLMDSVEVEEEVMLSTWYGALTSTGALKARDASVAFHAPRGPITLGHVQAGWTRIEAGTEDVHLAHLHSSSAHVSSTSGRIDATLHPTGPVTIRTDTGEIHTDVDLGLVEAPPAQSSGEQPPSPLHSSELESLRTVAEVTLQSRTGRIAARYRGQRPDVPLRSHVATGGAVNVVHPRLFQGQFNLSAQDVALSAPESKEWRLDPPSRLSAAWRGGKPRQMSPPTPHARGQVRSESDSSSPHVVGRTWLAGRSPYGLDEPGWGKSTILASKAPVVVAL